MRRSSDTHQERHQAIAHNEYRVQAVPKDTVPIFCIGQFSTTLTAPVTHLAAGVTVQQIGARAEQLSCGRDPIIHNNKSILLRGTGFIHPSAP